MPQTFHHLTRLRSAVGEREKWSGDGETAGTKAERNAAAEPQTEARRCCGQHPLPLVTSARFCGVERASSRGRRGDGQPVERSNPRVGHGGQTGLTELHCDGLLKFKSGSDELSHLTMIVSQLVFALAVGQVKFFHADKFDLKLFDLLERERGESGLRFTAEHLADEDREGAAVGKHGLVHDLDWQAVAKQTARDQAIPMMAGTVAPLQECLVLGWRGLMTTNVAIGGHGNDFRVGRRAFDPAMFVTAAEDVCLEFHGCEFIHSAIW